MIRISDLSVAKEIPVTEMLSIRGGAFWSYFITFNAKKDFGTISDGTSNTLAFGESIRS